MSQSAAAVPTAAPRVLPEQGSRVTRRARRRALRPFLMVGGVVAVIAASGAYWLHSGRIEGIIIYGGTTFDLGFEAVDWTREWIRKVGPTKL